MPSKEIMPPSTSHPDHHHPHLNAIHHNQQQQPQLHIQPIQNHNHSDQIQNHPTNLLQQQQQQQQPQNQQQQLIQKKSDFVSVEELVHEIKENLRLKARPPSHQLGGRSRPSPYHIPCRSWNDQQQPQQLQQQQQQQSFIINNSNNILCTECNNLSSNNLNNINNIEKSIECQTCKMNNITQQQQYNNNNLHHRFHHLNQKKDQDIDDPYELLQKLLKSKNLVKEAVRRLQLNNISPKQRSYFYESDEESRSPMFRVCQLEL